MSVRALMRENIRNLDPYRCARDDAGEPMRVYLDANENYAPLIGIENVNRYPDSTNSMVAQAIEKAIGIPSSKMCIGNGSDELIDILIRIFCSPREDSILVLPPTYGEYAVLANINEVKVVECPLEKDFSINLERILAAINEYRPKLTFICSPNNPTGNSLDRDAILTIAKENPGITVVDHAYIDFSSTEGVTVEDVDANERLVILRTLSKAWALAGARVGYLIACPEILSSCYDVKYPYNVSLPAQRAAVEDLSDVTAYKARLETLLQNRKWTMEAMAAIPGCLEVLPTDANFFLARFEQPVEIYNKLKERGIVVRDRSGNLYCEGCLRFTIGSADECIQLIDALKEILA